MTLQKMTSNYTVLDPRLLGRPIHRLPAFAGQLKEVLQLALRTPARRRFWRAMQVDSVAFSRLDGSEPRQRWLNLLGAAWPVGFAIERKLVLRILQQRYGNSGAAPSPAPNDESAAVTATEDRLSVLLAKQLSGILTSHVARAPAKVGGMEAPPASFSVSAGAPPPAGTWIITVVLREGEESAQFWFALDSALMAAVLRALPCEREEGRRSGRIGGAFPSRLQLQVQGRLVHKELALGSVFDLTPGAVIPINLRRADVLLEESRLFTAVVIEHKGKLCLTSFELCE